MARRIENTDCVSTFLARVAEETVCSFKANIFAFSSDKGDMNKTVVIFNPKSGSSGDDFRAQIEEALDSRGIEYSIVETQENLGGDELARRAYCDGAKHIFACGGDGTVMAVVNGLAREMQKEGQAGADENAPVLSIVPGGTANLLATALDIPHDVEKAIAIAIAGEVRVLDLGRCGPHFFALGVGLGLTERLVSRTSTKQKETLGKAAYALAMLRELGARPVTFTLKRDDKRSQRKRGVAVIIANAGEIGGKMKFAPDAKMDDGLLDICILHRFFLRDAFRLVWNMLTGNVRQDRAVSFYQAKRVEIRSDPPLDLQVDGEVVEMQTPLVCEIVPRALKVRVLAKEEKF